MARLFGALANAGAQANTNRFKRQQYDDQQAAQARDEARRVFEFAAFENGTKVIAQAIAESSAFSIAGGGDTLAAIAKYGIEQQVGYISTGGGAFLEILEGKTLPAFEILTRRAAGG